MRAIISIIEAELSVAFWITFTIFESQPTGIWVRTSRPRIIWCQIDRLRKFHVPSHVVVDATLWAAFTFGTPEAGWTVTLEGVDVVSAVCSILTRILSAIINVNLTIDACKAIWANASVAALFVETLRPVSAWIVVALVDV